MELNQIVSVSEFKANCLAVPDRLASDEFDPVIITKSGQPVEVLWLPGKEDHIRPAAEP